MAFPDTLFGYPVDWIDEQLVELDENTIIFEPLYKRYITFKCKKEGHDFTFTIAELESMIREAEMLINKE